MLDSFVGARLSVDQFIQTIQAVCGKNMFSSSKRSKFVELCKFLKANIKFSLIWWCMWKKQKIEHLITQYISLYIHTHTDTSFTANQIDSKGAESLAEALKSNTTLTQLNLGGE
jgi:hypothetical protein